MITAKVSGVKTVGEMHKLLTASPPDHDWRFCYNFGNTPAQVKLKGWRLYAWLAGFDPACHIRIGIDEAHPEGTLVVICNGLLYPWNNVMDQDLLLTVEDWNFYLPVFSPESRQYIFTKTVGREHNEVVAIRLPHQEVDRFERQHKWFRRQTERLKEHRDWDNSFFFAVKKGDQKGLMVGRTDLFQRILFVDITQVGKGIHNILRDENLLGIGYWEYAVELNPALYGWGEDEEGNRYIRENFS